MSEKSPKWLPKMALDIAKCSLKSPYENHCYTTWKICGKKASVNSMSAENYTENFANIISGKKKQTKIKTKQKKNLWYWTNLFCWINGSSLRPDSEKKKFILPTKRVSKFTMNSNQKMIALGCANSSGLPKSKWADTGKSQNPGCLKGTNILLVH